MRDFFEIEVAGFDFVEPFLLYSNFKNRRRRTLSEFSKKPGVYIIRENGVIVYIGMSQSCVVEALYRHFYPWSQKRHGRDGRYRVTYVDRLEKNKYTVVIMETSKEEAPLIERGMVLSIQPRDNADKFTEYVEQLKKKDDNGNGEHANEFSVGAGVNHDDLPF